MSASERGNHRGVSLIERGASNQMNDTHSGLKLDVGGIVHGCRHEEIMPA